MADALPIALLDELAGPSGGREGRVAAAVAAFPAHRDALEPIGDLLVDPAADVVLLMHRADQTLEVRGKLGLNGFVVAVPEGPGAAAGWWQVAPITGAPRLVASLVGIGPRERDIPEGAVIPLPAEAIFEACGTTAPAGFVAPLIETMVADGYRRDALEAILSPDALLWQLSLFASADALEPARTLAIIDTETHGMWLALEVDGGAVLQSVSPTGAFRVLCDTLDILSPTPQPAGDTVGLDA